MKKECDVCGLGLPDSARFCSRCGRNMDLKSPSADLVIRSTTTLTPLLRQWRELKYDLTRKEVRRVLGEPARIDPPSMKTGNVYTEIWTYIYESAAGGDQHVSGTLRFATPDGRLTSWTEPDWPALRKAE